MKESSLEREEKKKNLGKKYKRITIRNHDFCNHLMK
jgi:hypothetical protein